MLCYSKEVLEIDNSDDSDHESFDVESVFLGAVDTSTLESQWTIKIHVNGKQVLFKVDTGAEVTAITEQTYLQLGKPPLASCTQESPIRSIQPIVRSERTDACKAGAQ